MKDWFFKFLHKAAVKFHNWASKFEKNKNLVTWDSKTDTITVDGITKGRGE